MNDKDILICQLSRYTGIPVRDSLSMEYLISLLGDVVTFSDYFNFLNKVREDPNYTAEQYPDLPAHLMDRVNEVLKTAKDMNIYRVTREF